ncbi:hypothetical protein BDA99DRAFT_593201 [Phascolomyces articulosus]|uniref:Uncharacterized protein n=1 Tax=Phascolomyces articulosus TaxID=60185 RepID=A0AAD5KJJ0_9FUNG|nr:hypothetical protein BDA99DRAFT_593201 [Phascolomyces articulosus]
MTCNANTMSNNTSCYRQVFGHGDPSNANALFIPWEHHITTLTRKSTTASSVQDDNSANSGFTTLGSSRVATHQHQRQQQVFMSHTTVPPSTAKYAQPKKRIMPNVLPTAQLFANLHQTMSVPGNQGYNGNETGRNSCTTSPPARTMDQNFASQPPQHHELSINSDAAKVFLSPQENPIMNPAYLQSYGKLNGFNILPNVVPNSASDSNPSETHYPSPSSILDQTMGCSDSPTTTATTTAHEFIGRMKTVVPYSPSSSSTVDDKAVSTIHSRVDSLFPQMVHSQAGSRHVQSYYEDPSAASTEVQPIRNTKASEKKKSVKRNNEEDHNINDEHMNEDTILKCPVQSCSKTFQKKSEFVWRHFVPFHCGGQIFYVCYMYTNDEEYYKEGYAGRLDTVMAQIKKYWIKYCDYHGIKESEDDESIVYPEIDKYEYEIVGFLCRFKQNTDDKECDNIYDTKAEFEAHIHHHLKEVQQQQFMQALLYYNY